jgi:hypothetical protein
MSVRYPAARLCPQRLVMPEKERLAVTARVPVPRLQEQHVAALGDPFHRRPSPSAEFRPNAI